jgi:hypothetical protein
MIHKDTDVIKISLKVPNLGGTSIVSTSNMGVVAGRLNTHESSEEVFLNVDEKHPIAQHNFNSNLLTPPRPS